MSAILIDGKLVSAKLRGEVTEKRIEFEKKYGRKQKKWIDTRNSKGKTIL